MMNFAETRLWGVFLGVMSVCSSPMFALSQTRYVSDVYNPGSFCLARVDDVAGLYVHASDFPGVLRAAKDLQADIGRVTGQVPELVSEVEMPVVIIGTLGKCPLLDTLVETGKINVASIKGKWESFLIEVVASPLPGVTQALIIAGSDKRGTIYGIYDLCEQVGVSPWHWWADVPVPSHEALYIASGSHVQGPPAVKYRGIFLNDEEPALGRWAVEKYGGFNHQCYETVFELILRLKGNYLWPAMWWASFNSDDPLNPKLADEYGIVVGTTHHEPMMRAHAEWKNKGLGAWNYDTNAEALRTFWTEGIERMGARESIVTLAMRGDGDMAMSQDTNIALLERIVADQRQILGHVTGKDVTTIPQVWALYKEVQDYYDKGMRVPDDVTLLLCDDNWGNVRRLPRPDAPHRAGGYGMYYHFDFVGGPRNYKWLNTSPIARVWEQMNLTYRHGVDRIWLVNVGDLKPMEFPISFFLEYAWNPDAWPAERLHEYTRLWAQQQFGSEHAAAIAEILADYTRFNSRRKPEMLAPDTYSLIHYQEAESVVAEYNALARKAITLSQAMSADHKDAFYELVLHPVMACANLNELHVTVGKNRLYATQGRAATNDLAQHVEDLFNRDVELSLYYNKVLAQGKWNHMMDQTHISYTNWQQPNKDVMPEVETLEIPQDPNVGVAIEGSILWWPKATKEASLPAFNPYDQQSHYIEVFNRGSTPFEVQIDCNESWVQVTPSSTAILKEQRLWVSIDWAQTPLGDHKVPIHVTALGQEVTVWAFVHHPEKPTSDWDGFVESQGVVSMEAEHYTTAFYTESIQWQVVPDLSRTLSGVITVPVTASSVTPSQESPRLEYCVHLWSAGTVKVHTYGAPTRSYLDKQGLRYGISFDQESPQILNIHEHDTIPDWHYPPAWSQAVGDNVMITTSEHTIQEPGEHTLKFWRVDPGVVLQKIVIDTGGLKPSYLGPPESCFRSTQSK